MLVAKFGRFPPVLDAPPSHRQPFNMLQRARAIFSINRQYRKGKSHSCTRKCLVGTWCSLVGRAGLPGATILIPVLEAPRLDMCPGRLATTDAQ